MTSIFIVRPMNSTSLIHASDWLLHWPRFIWQLESRDQFHYHPVCNTSSLSSLNMHNLTTTSTSEIVTGLESVWNIFVYVMNFINIYMLMFILVFGFCGNSLSIAIFIKRRHHDSASSSYLAPLAFFDITNIIAAMVYWFGSRLRLFDFVGSSTSCLPFVFIYLACQYISGWTLVVFSIERSLSVWFPLKMRSILTPKTRRRSVLILLLGLPMFLITLVPTGDSQSETQACLVPGGTPLHLALLSAAIYYGMPCIFPSIIVAVANMMILLGIKRQNRERKKMMKNEDHTEAAKTEKRCLRNLLVISVFYIIFMFPCGIMRGMVEVLPSADMTISERLQSLAIYSAHWCGLNYCINPILYAFSLPYYREEARYILTCGKITTLPSTTAGSKSS